MGIPLDVVLAIGATAAGPLPQIFSECLEDWIDQQI
jgi:hypothetical protein